MLNVKVNSLETEYYCVKQMSLCAQKLNY